jgi:hypothetical protein
MTRQKEEEFQVADMPNLSGYVAIVTGGKYLATTFYAWE